MKTKEIFEFTDYKAFILHAEERGSHLQKGFRSRMAEAIECQSAFISQLLNGKAHLSLEQALRLAIYLKLDSSEKKFFLLLVEYTRAGTQELRAHFRDLLNMERENHLRIKNRVKAEMSFSVEAQSIYYSHWQYSAIHMLVTIPEFQSIEAIAKALKISTGRASEVVVFLVKLGLLAENRGKLRPGPTQIHLDRASPNISKHHTNWRVRAIESLGETIETDTHYSTVSSLSNTDVEEIRAKIVALIEDYTVTVRPSKEETLYCFNIDFFQLIT